MQDIIYKHRLRVTNVMAYLDDNAQDEDDDFEDDDITLNED